jgi:hypothetical protein
MKIDCLAALMPTYLEHPNRAGKIISRYKDPRASARAAASKVTKES